MHLPSGVRLGPYEIVKAIGAGGMGEVYRARDDAARRGARRCANFASIGRFSRPGSLTPDA